MRWLGRLVRLGLVFLLLLTIALFVSSRWVDTYVRSTAGVWMNASLREGLQVYLTFGRRCVYVNLQRYTSTYADPNLASRARSHGDEPLVRGGFGDSDWLPALIAPRASLLGAQVGFFDHVSQYTSWSGRTQAVEAIIPLWMVIAPLGSVLLGWVIIRRRHDHAVRAGACPACGYDVRATAERCPECGAIPAPSQQSLSAD